MILKDRIEVLMVLYGAGRISAQDALAAIGDVVFEEDETPQTFILVGEAAMGNKTRTGANPVMVVLQ